LRIEERSLVKDFVDNLKIEKPQIIEKLNKKCARLYNCVLGGYTL